MTTNATDLEKQFNMLREQIENSLEKAQVQKNTLKRNNSRFTQPTLSSVPLPCF